MKKEREKSKKEKTPTSNWVIPTSIYFLSHFSTINNFKTLKTTKFIISIKSNQNKMQRWIRNNLNWSLSDLNHWPENTAGIYRRPPETVTQSLQVSPFFPSFIFLLRLRSRYSRSKLHCAPCEIAEIHTLGLSLDFKEDLFNEMFDNSCLV